ncbi:GNAT family N-acetyltransferase [Baaleninema simplex]|uniref:GNAT family N-acetyltransferase n=1 Tax=Baaleninema simplex TaxID=2862350 RepID=UPI000349C350|nr:GNAT family N-acetyltransferase [Baaleninema simplex]
MNIDFNSNVKVRAARVDDVDAVFGLIRALAAYEGLSHQVVGDAETLKAHLFGERPYAEVLVAERDDKIVGFALFFQTYSTFLTRAGLYLEDLFVLPEERGQGIGTALIQQVAKIAVERQCGRVEWAVLDWNAPAIAFYDKVGASVLPDWRICRVSDRALQHLASSRIFTDK